jgi:hypothetical protein
MKRDHDLMCRWKREEVGEKCLQGKTGEPGANEASEDGLAARFLMLDAACPSSALNRTNHQHAPSVLCGLSGAVDACASWC